MSTERDANGDLQWDPVAFPTGHTLGDYVHSKGFKFGMCGSHHISLRHFVPAPF